MKEASSAKYPDFKAKINLGLSMNFHSSAKFPNFVATIN